MIIKAITAIGTTATTSEAVLLVTQAGGRGDGRSGLGGHIGDRGNGGPGYYGHRHYGRSGPIFCYPGNPIICHPSTPIIGHPSTPIIGHPGGPNRPMISHPISPGSPITPVSPIIGQVEALTQ